MDGAVSDEDMSPDDNVATQPALLAGEARARGDDDDDDLPFVVLFLCALEHKISCVGSKQKEPATSKRPPHSRKSVCQTK